MKPVFSLRLLVLWFMVACSSEAEVRYVWRDNPSVPVPPYTGGWAKAATNIQDAVDAAASGDTVLVTNGLYNAGGRVAPGDTTLKTRVVITNAITVISVNGPEGTRIVGAPHAGSANGLGDAAYRGVYLTNNAVLSGFTVTNGFTRSGTTAANAYYGGGIRAESASALITNCAVSANGAGTRGGGVYLGTLIDCVVVSNAVTSLGGGVYGATVLSSRIERNRAAGSSSDGGGAYGGALVGCTVVSNSAGHNGGGSLGSALTNCTVEANAAATSGGGAYTPVAVSNCVIRGNTAVTSGGGVYQGFIQDTQIVSNRVTGSSGEGGGYYGNAAGNRLLGCVVECNEAGRSGGGVYNAVLSNCLVRANRAYGNATSYGGGGAYANAASYSAYRCLILDNQAIRGGGAYQGVFYSCAFSGNLASEGGGVYLNSSGYQLNSCSVTGNSATNKYGGTYAGTIKNSIVYGNSATNSPNYSGGTITYTCAVPLPSGAGNMSADPKLGGYADPHLLSGSPCIGAGQIDAWMANAVDIDGEARVVVGLTDMGSDQFNAAGLAGPLTVEITAATNVSAVGWAQAFRAEAAGRVGGIVWDFGDGTGNVDVNPAGHAFAAAGTYTVSVTVTNGTHTTSASYTITVEDYIRYVSLAGGHIAPFDTWEKAATNIQAAVDAVALPGGRVVVTNGVYDVGGRVAGSQTTTNRLVLDKAVRVVSVNGPVATAIVGRWNSEAVPLGALSVRGVYIGAAAVLDGFTVTNGATVYAATDSGRGGGLFLAQGGVATNCVVGNCRGWSGGGAAGAPGLGGTLQGCALSGNVGVNAGSINHGGGAADLTLVGCTVATNTAYQGGGVYMCALDRCVLAGNVASSLGGGAYDSTLTDCELRGNTAVVSAGGGVYLGTLSRCRLSGNTAITSFGGGAYDATLTSCVLSGNRAYQGGGAYGSTAAKGMFNCTVAGNAATAASPVMGGGGVHANNTNYTVRNCIVYYNTAAVSNNLYQGTVQNTCADPLPAGQGNIGEAPRVASYERPVLLPGSPCVGAGLVEGWMAEALDFEGEARTTGSTVDIGADQTHAESLNDPLTVAVSGPEWPYFPNTEYAFTALVGGHPNRLYWDFGDGQTVADLAQVTHSWPEGSYTVRLTVSNDTHSAEATFLLEVAPDTRHVAPSGSHTPPFRTWGTAATNLQTAADVVFTGGRIKVAAGTYNRGGRAASGEALANRLLVTNAVSVIAVDGPGVTFIVGAPSGAPVTNGLGAGAVRGVRLAAGASLQGFSVISGRTFWSTTATTPDYTGGGVYCADGTCVLSNCAVTGNAAAGQGGGVFQGTLLNSTLEGNAVCALGQGIGLGGGAYNASFISICVVRANWARSSGGGAYVSADGLVADSLFDGNVSGNSGGGFCASFSSEVLRRCVVVNNTCSSSGGGVYGATLYDCLLTNNAAWAGGGYAANLNASIYRCRLLGNRATTSGGGAKTATLYSCVVSGNSAATSGGGTYNSTMESCTVVDNKAVSGGAAYFGSTYSSLLYANQSAAGVESETTAPQLSGLRDPHLLPGSPCIDSGEYRNWMAGAESRDIDGEARVAGVTSDLGADEFNADTLTGPLSVSVAVDQPSFGLAYAPEFRAEAAGKVGALLWDFGDGSSVINQNPVRHTFPGLGEYTVRVTVTNLTGGAVAEVTVLVVEGNTYVDLNGGHVAPFGSWATAATNIQDAVDAAVWGGTVWVTNGVYASGGRPATGQATTNRVCVEHLLTVRSLSGSEGTVIQGAWHAPAQACGDGAVRGVWLGAGASLVGFTITNCATHAGADDNANGGGLYAAAEGAVIRNCTVAGCVADNEGGGGWGGMWQACVLRGNGALVGGGLAKGTMTDGNIEGNSANYGGGSYESTLGSCQVADNVSWVEGGGAYAGSLYTCTVVGNRADGSGGGSCDAWLYDCTVSDNTASGSGGGVCYGTVFNTQVNRNSSASGGGCSQAELFNCKVTDNLATTTGGGCNGGTLYDCLLTNNAAQSGGGYYLRLNDGSGALYRCRVWDNRASAEGGGVYGGTLFSSVVAGNVAGQTGGGTYESTLESCSVLGNAAGLQAGGCQGGVAFNSILYHNRAPVGQDVVGTVCDSCCTPDSGAVTAPPQVAGFREPHLLPWSPCIDVGAYRYWMAEGSGFSQDIDLEVRVAGGSTDIGADETTAAPLAGPLAIEVSAERLTVTVGSAQEFLAEISGLPSGLVWDFGDGTSVTNQNPMSHAFGSTGVYTVRATATHATDSVFAEILITVGAGDVFVALGGTHVPPFATWETAATNIQDAVDAAPSGGTVHIADGTYELGGRPAAGCVLTNRVCIETPILVQGENGPSGVIVRGAWHAPETACGAASVRGVYLGHPDARLSGVTVEGGATADAGETDGGGVYCAFDAAVASNCVVRNCSAAGGGGGVWRGTWYDSQFSSNTAQRGGGYYAPQGVSTGVLYRCRVWDNQAREDGGGTYGGVLYSSVIAVNAAGWTGGGTYEAILESCSLLGNAAGQYAGGSYAGTAYNSIIYHNRAPVAPDAAEIVCENCCTPYYGSVIAQPQVAGFREPYLLPGSPCIDAGAEREWMTGAEGLDRDRMARIVGAGTDIGAVETAAAALAGPLAITVSAETLVVAPRYAQAFQAEISGLPSGLDWAFGDGMGAVNENPVKHAFADAGVYTIRATASNATDSVFTEFQVVVIAGDAFVTLGGTHEAPFATWETAATNIQSAVDAAPWGGTVHIADGTYELGGRPATGQSHTNRVCIEKPVTVLGENGPSAVIVRGAWHAPETACGAGAVRGAYLGHPAARLTGVTVTGGATADAGETEGGGVSCAFNENTVSNCVVTDSRSAWLGGGARGGAWIDCQLSGNVADWYGGGMALCYNSLRCVLSGNVALRSAGGSFGGSLSSCLVVGNEAGQAGGAMYAYLNNCTVSANVALSDIGGVGWCNVANSIVWENSAPVATNALESTLDHCDTWPLPAGEYDVGGNISADPQFVDPLGGNYRLSATSPCINAGTNMPWIVGETDLDGRARFVNGIVDLGAYEYVVTASIAALGTPIVWLDSYQLGPDWDAAELGDPDGDGFPTWQEYVALTSPTNGASFFTIRGVASTLSQVNVSFDTAVGRDYTVQHSRRLAPASWSNAVSTVSGDGGRMTVAVPDSGGSFFYRVRVALP